MEIMRRTPWSGIREQYSVYKEFLEVVYNGKPTGSVWKETVAVSATISMSVEKSHSRIGVRILSCSRMREMRREPEVPEERVPVVECLDGPARTNSFCKKLESSRMLVLQDHEWLQIREKCSYAHRQVDDQPTKWSKKNGDKSAVAMLKKNDLHKSIRQPVVNRDKSHDRPVRPDIKRDTCHELIQRPVGRRSSNARQLGCVFHDMKPPKSILRKSSDIQRPIQRVKFAKAIARHSNSRKNPSLSLILPDEPSSAQLQRSKIWGSVSGGDRVARTRCPRSSVEAGQKCIKIKGAWKSNILLTFGK